MYNNTLFAILEYPQNVSVTNHSEQGRNLTIIKKFKANYPYLYRSLLWTPILAFVALFSAEGGHGAGIFFILIFPFSILVPIMFSIEENKYVDIIVLSLFIMPVVYGLILTVVERRGFPVKDAAIMIGLVHLFLLLTLDFIMMYGGGGHGPFVYPGWFLTLLFCLVSGHGILVPIPYVSVGTGFCGRSEKGRPLSVRTLLPEPLPFRKL